MGYLLFWCYMAEENKIKLHGPCCALPVFFLTLMLFYLHAEIVLASFKLDNKFEGLNPPIVYCLVPILYCLVMVD